MSRSDFNLPNSGDECPAALGQGVPAGDSANKPKDRDHPNFGAFREPHRARRTVAIDPDEVDMLSHLLAGLREVVKRGVALLIRQSTGAQAERNVGSAQWQMQQLDILRSYGVTLETVTIFDARGESGTEGAHKPVVTELLERVERGEFGVVVCAFADRIARFEADSRRLYDAIRRVGGRIVINGQIFNPADPTQRMILQFYAMLAEFENSQRTFRFVTSRNMLARSCALPIGLPTGLVWASPEDPAYLKLATDAGLRHWVDKIDPSHAKARVSGRDLYILPEPDREVFASIELRFEWLLQHRNLDAVIERVRSDPRWPRPGHVPVARTHMFDPTRRPEWVSLFSVTTKDRKQAVRRATGSRAAAAAAFAGDSPRPIAQRARLDSFFRSPAYYTIYRFTPSALTDRPEVAQILGKGISEPHKMPQYFCAPERRAEVLGLLRDPSKSFAASAGVDAARKPLAHALPMVVCAHPHGDGRPCGRQLGRFKQGPGSYRSLGCGVNFGHSSSIPQSLLDEVVLEVIATALSPEIVAPALDRVRLRTGASDRQLETLVRRERQLTGKIDYFAHQAFEASQRREAAAERLRLLRAAANDTSTMPLVVPTGEPSVFVLSAPDRDESVADAQASFEAASADEADWRRQHAETVRERRAVEAERAIAERDATTTEDIQAAEYAEILSLGQRVAVLLQRAQGDPSRLRAFVAACIKAVHVWTIGMHAHSVEVEFPCGARVHRIVFSKCIHSTQPERVAAWAALRPWLALPARVSALPAAAQAAEVVAATLNRLRPLIEVVGQHKVIARYTPWDGDRVWAMALQHEHFETVEGRDPVIEPHRTPADIAETYGATEDEVLAAAFGGRLGPARLIDGVFMLAPSEAEIHLCMPEVARRTVAAENRWPLEDTVLVADLVAELRPDLSRTDAWKAVPMWVRTLAKLAKDAVRRRYTRRSWFGLRAAEVFKAWYDQEAPASVTAYPLEHWRSQEQVYEQYEQFPMALVRANAPTARPAVHPNAQIGRYYWMGPEIVARLTSMIATGDG